MGPPFGAAQVLWSSDEDIGAKVENGANKESKK